jgi:hypothetical protein
MTIATAGQGLSSDTILTALQNHYRKPGAPRDGEVLIPEVQAPGSNRRADLVRVGMWASRGTGIDVHEIKTSRSDWLRELDDPAKAEAWWPYSNRFWVVTPPGTVHDGELPEGWGLMELPATGRRFKVRVTAVTRKDIILTVPLLIELLRRADNQRLAEIDRLRDQHRNDLYKVDQEWRARKAESDLPPGLRARLRLLEQVEALTGLRLDEYGDPHQDQPQEMTPAELALILTDAASHVTVQRRARDLARRQKDLRAAAAAVIRHLDQAPRETADPTQDGATL